MNDGVREWMRWGGSLACFFGNVWCLAVAPSFVKRYSWLENKPTDWAD